MANKKKKSWKLLGGLILLVILIVVYYGVSKMADEDSETESETTEEIAVLDMDTTTITSFSFISGDDTLTFVKENDLWSYAADPDFPVLQTSIESMIANLATVTAVNELTDIDDLAEYGLEEPSQVISITTEDGSTTTLTIGDLNVSTSNYYVYLSDQTTVYTIATTIPTAFAIELYDLADVASFPTVDTSTLYYASIEQEDSKIEMIDDSGEGTIAVWKIKKNDGDAKAADSASISTLFENISSFAFDSCVEYNAEDLSKYGLDQPTATITMKYTVEYEETSDETTQTDTSETETEAATITVEEEVVLYIGNQAATEAIEEITDETSADEAETEEPVISYYVQVEGSNEVHIMSATYLEAFLNMSVENYYDTYVSYHSISAVSKLIVTYNGEEYELTTETVTETTTETSESGEDEETETSATYYYVNEEEVTYVNYTGFFGSAVNMVVESYLSEEVSLDGEPAIALEFVLEDETVIVEYFQYNANFYAVETAQGIALVNKLDVANMITALETLVSELSE